MDVIKIDITKTKNSISITSIKIIALICMIIGHIQTVNWFHCPSLIYLSYDFNALLRFIVKIAFPLFAFVVANGWIHTKNKRDYFMRMVIFACISQIPYTMAFYPSNFLTPVRENNIDFYFCIDGYFLAIFCILIFVCSIKIVKFSLPKSLIILGSVLVSAIFLDIDGFRYLCDELNIFYIFIVSLFMIYCFEKIKSKSLKWYEQAIIILTFVLSFLLVLDLNSVVETLNMSLVFLLYVTYKNRKIQSLIIVLWGLIVYGIIYGTIPFEIYRVFKPSIPAFISAGIILLYNDSIPPKKARWFYWVYPIHLLALGIINLLYLK